MENSGTTYTVISAPELETKLSSALKELAISLNKLPIFQGVEVILGGGYGRGEGGVFHNNMLYNDLDFFVFTDNYSKKQQQELDRLLAPIAEKMAQKLQLDVDFAPARNYSTLKKVGSTLMYQELLNGHKIVTGNGKFTQFLPKLTPNQIPWIEGVRLLLNRGMGLLFAGEHLADKSSDINFILRNLNKAVLGCGDAKLINCGCYCWRGNDRVEAVAKNPLTPQEPELYKQAWSFKVKPDDQIPNDLDKRWLHIRELWQKTVCLIADSADKSPEQVAKSLHKSCKVKGETSWRNRIKWAIKNRNFKWEAAGNDAPVSRLLAELYTILTQENPYPRRTAPLYMGWEKFN